MSELHGEDWALGTYNLASFKQKMLRNAYSLCRLFHSTMEAVKGLPDVEQQQILLDALTAEAVQTLGTLPKGVSYRIPGEGNSADGTLLPQHVYVAANPLNSGGRDYGVGRDYTADIAVQIGERVAAVYSVALQDGEIYYLHPDSSQIMSLNEHSEAHVLEQDSAAFTSPTILFQGDQEHHALRGLLGEEQAGCALSFAQRSHTACLLDVIRGRAVAYARPAQEETAPWIDLPLIGFGGAAGIRVFSVEDGYLDEVPLAPRKYAGSDNKPGRPSWEADGLKVRGHGLLYVSSVFVSELHRHVPVTMLGE